MRLVAIVQLCEHLFVHRDERMRILAAELGSRLSRGSRVLIVLFWFWFWFLFRLWFLFLVPRLCFDARLGRRVVGLTGQHLSALLLVNILGEGRLWIGFVVERRNARQR